MDPAFDSKGFIYVADTYNHRIQKFTPEARFVDILGTKGSESGELSHPSGITVDDLLYVTKNINKSIFTAKLMENLFNVFERRVTRRTA